MIDYACSRCGQTMSSPAVMAGGTETCPCCATPIIVPEIVMPPPPVVLPSAPAKHSFGRLGIIVSLILIAVLLGIVCSLPVQKPSPQPPKPSAWLPVTPVFDMPNLARMTMPQIKKELGKPTKEVAPEFVRMNLNIRTAEWQRPPIELQIDYYASGEVKSFFMMESQGLPLTQEELFAYGNLDKKSKDYHINIIAGPFGKGIASIEITPLPKNKPRN